MRKLIYKFLSIFINNNSTWPLIRPFALFGKNLLFIREKHERKQNIPSHIHNLFQNQIVLYGPFKGMKYNTKKGFYSAIYPKLLGCYESEIHPVIEKCCGTDYSEIIDVGCAEGYYAVGLSIRLPKAKVFAYDIDKQARELCQEMANLNQVADRVEIRSFCSPQELRDFEFTRKGLVISDCEGFEKQLFTPENISNLQQADVLIEIHDFADITISEYIYDLFKDTHNIERIKSLDDIEKIRRFSFKEIEGLSFQTKKILLSEGRPVIMEWFFCTKKNSLKDEVCLYRNTQ